MTYAESISWLNSTRRFGIKLGLDNTRLLFEKLGNPQHGLQFLHVAGTNGKGSVCAFLDSMLRAAGMRSGLYTSPHLVSFRERARVDGQAIAEDDAARILTRIRSLCEADFQPTCFEIITAMALVHFAEQNCEMVAWETGMGGRLDATNVVQPKACGITRIGMDHQGWLGQSLAAIAAEKAGIIKPGIPIVSAPQQSEAAVVLRETAIRMGAAITFVENPPRQRELAMAGPHQMENAALAVEMMRAAQIALDEPRMEQALSRTTWAGRFQFIEPELVLDGAHNPAGAAALAQAWRAHFQARKAVVIFGAMRDKDIAAQWSELLPIIDRAIFVAGEGPRWMPATSLQSMLTGVEVSIAADISEALVEARSTGLPILITGSLFLVGLALSELQGIPQDWADA